MHRIRTDVNPGRFFEDICVFHLLMSNKLANILRFSCIDPHTRDLLMLPSKKDVGIDLVAWSTCGQPIAIQCKFRSDMYRSLNWKTFATFDSLCSRTGPWKRKILITTAPAIAFYGLKRCDEDFIVRDHFKRMSDGDRQALVRLAEMPM